MDAEQIKLLWWHAPDPYAHMPTPRTDLSTNPAWNPQCC